MTIRKSLKRFRNKAWFGNLSQLKWQIHKLHPHKFQKRLVVIPCYSQFVKLFRLVFELTSVPLTHPSPEVEENDTYLSDIYFMVYS